MKNLISIFLAFLFLASGVAFARGKEEIAVAARDKVPWAAVSDRAGTSPFFLLFDRKGKLKEVIENPYKTEAGAGEAVADFLAGKGVRFVVAEGFGGPLLVSEIPPRGATVVVAEGFGPKIVDVMKGKGIRAVAFKGSVEEAVKKVLQPK